MWHEAIGCSHRHFSGDVFAVPSHNASTPPAPALPPSHSDGKPPRTLPTFTHHALSALPPSHSGGGQPSPHPHHGDSFLRKDVAGQHMIVLTLASEPAVPCTRLHGLPSQRLLRSVSRPMAPPKRPGDHLIVA